MTWQSPGTGLSQWRWYLLLHAQVTGTVMKTWTAPSPLLCSGLNGPLAVVQSAVTSSLITCLLLHSLAVHHWGDPTLPSLLPLLLSLAALPQSLPLIQTTLQQNEYLVLPLGKAPMPGCLIGQWRDEPLWVLSAVARETWPHYIKFAN